MRDLLGYTLRYVFQLADKILTEESGSKSLFDPAMRHDSKYALKID